MIQVISVICMISARMAEMCVCLIDREVVIFATRISLLSVESCLVYTLQVNNTSGGNKNKL